MHPAASVRLGRIRDLLERVERPRRDVARLRADQRRAAVGSKHLPQLVRPHPPLPVDPDRTMNAAPHPEQPQRREHRRMRLLADDDVHPRRAPQAVPLDVVSGTAPATHAAPPRAP